jgi:hypothetical protein
LDVTEALFDVTNPMKVSEELAGGKWLRPRAQGRQIAGEISGHTFHALFNPTRRIELQQRGQASAGTQAAGSASAFLENGERDIAAAGPASAEHEARIVAIGAAREVEAEIK